MILLELLQGMTIKASDFLSAKYYYSQHNKFLQQITKTASVFRLLLKGQWSSGYKDWSIVHIFEDYLDEKSDEIIDDILHEKTDIIFSFSPFF